MARTPAPLTARERALDARLHQVAGSYGGVVRAAQANDLGARPGDIRRLMQARLWSRPRHSVYADARYRSASPDPAHAVLAAAVVAAVDPGVVVSHDSAVRLLGLPRPYWLPTTVSLTRRPPAHGNHPAGARMHVADFEESTVTKVHGVPLLGGARLVIDACHELSGADALAVADGALRRKLATPEDLTQELLRGVGTPHHRGAATVAERADSDAENWFESISRWWLLQYGLPRPTLQVPLYDDDGRIRARVDMLLEEEGVVGEADGAGKYAADPQALFEEKRREDWIRQVHNYEVVRWVPEEMRTALGRRGVLQRWWEAIDRARVRRERRRNT